MALDSDSDSGSWGTWIMLMSLGLMTWWPHTISFLNCDYLVETSNSNGIDFHEV